MNRASGIIFLFLMLMGSLASAREMSIYVGGGLNMSFLKMSVPEVADSDFNGLGYFAEAGLLLPFGSNYGLVAGAEYGKSRASNDVKDTDYLEEAKNTFLTFKGGFTIGSFGLGGGVRKNELTLKSVSSSSGGQEKIYSEATPLYYVNYSFESGRSSSVIRTTVEIQHCSGTLENIELEETAISLRLTLLFD